MDLQWLKIGDVNCHQINSSLIRPSLYKRNNTFYNQKNNSLHFNLNDSIDRRSQSRGILSLIEWSRLTREFIPTLVLLLLLVLKVVWREVKIWLKFSSINSKLFTENRLCMTIALNDAAHFIPHFIYRNLKDIKPFGYRAAICQKLIISGFKWSFLE